MQTTVVECENKNYVPSAFGDETFFSIACRPAKCAFCIIRTYTTIVLGDLCDNIGLVGVCAKWSYVTASPCHHDQAIPILSPLLFKHVGHPYIPLLNSKNLLVSPPFLVSDKYLTHFLFPCSTLTSPL